MCIKKLNCVGVYSLAARWSIEWTCSVVFVFTLEQSIYVLTVFLKSLCESKISQIDPNVDNFPNPMGPGPCTKKDSDSPEDIQEFSLIANKNRVLDIFFPLSFTGTDYHSKFVSPEKSLSVQKKGNNKDE